MSKFYIWQFEDPAKPHHVIVLFCVSFSDDDLIEPYAGDAEI